MAIRSNSDILNAEKEAVCTGTWQLPSCGILYRETVKDFPEDITVRAFGFNVEDILVQPGPSLPKMVSIVQDVVLNFPTAFNINDLLIGDLYAIIALARSLTYGADYRFTATCTACKHKEVVQIKTPEELPVESWKGKTIEDLRKGWIALLPMVSDSVAVLPMTVGKELEIEAARKLALVTDTSKVADPKQVYTVAGHIATVNGGSPDNLMEAVAYTRVLRGPDMIKLQEVVDGCAPGIKVAYDIMCDNCSTKFVATIPITSDFFRGNRV